MAVATLAMVLLTVVAIAAAMPAMVLPVVVVAATPEDLCRGTMPNTAPWLLLLVSTRTITGRESCV